MHIKSTTPVSSNITRKFRFSKTLVLISYNKYFENMFNKKRQSRIRVLVILIQTDDWPNSLTDLLLHTKCTRDFRIVNSLC